MDNDDCLNDVTAVAMVSYTGAEHDEGNATTYYYCVVTRYDKTLSIYKLSSEELLIKESSPTVEPYLTYQAPKRISRLQFANLPSSSSSSSSSSSTVVPVLIVSDLAGDAYAYSLVQKNSGRKLLLGHTASMLTGLVVLNNHSCNNNNNNNNNGDTTDSSYDGCCIATSDRDEKIRISRFPESYVVEGYLLGHTSFITGIASVNSKNYPYSLLVSCGGDQTIRLWDWKNLKELCHAPLEQREQEHAGQRDKEDNDSNCNKFIPSDIAVDNNGGIVSVAYDESTRISFYEIVYDESNSTEAAALIGSTNQTTTMSGTFSLAFVGNIDCPARPLNICFDKSNHNDDILLILMGDPEYINSYRIVRKTVDDVLCIVATKTNDSDDCGIRLQSVKDMAAKEQISMPKSILEKDKFGNLVLRKENETRGPAAADAPWNRVERLETAKEKSKNRERKRRRGNIGNPEARNEQKIEPTNQD
jgi:WD40 repeat protein